MTFLGATAQARVTGRRELPGKAHYFIGRDPAKWRAHVPTYAQVHYQDLYPGIDLLWYSNPRQLEYDFVVAPGAGVDAQAALWLAQLPPEASPRLAPPLPVFGYPGWLAESERAAFYDDTRYFRPYGNAG